MNLKYFFSKMKKINAIIEKSNDGTFNVFCKDYFFSGMGDTAESAKEDLQKQMAFFKATAKEQGFKYPEFLDKEFEIAYEFDTKSLLEYYSGILTLAGLEKITGINQKQLWTYLHTNTKPREKQIKKIELGLHKLGAELSSISM